MSRDAQRRKGRTIVLLVVLVFAAPIVAAWLVYFVFPGVIPEMRTNNGHLLQPHAKPVVTFSVETAQGNVISGKDLLRDKWTMLYIGSSKCGQTCHQRLRNMLKIEQVLQRDASRIQRVFVVTDKENLAALRAFAAQQQPGLKLVLSTGNKLRAFLNTAVEQAGSNGDVYLFDPNTNWVLYYRPGESGMGILHDLRHLLKQSTIG